MTRFEMQAAWSAKHHIATHGALRAPELSLYESYGLTRSGPIPIRRASDDTWEVPLQFSEHYGEWVQRIMTSEPLRKSGGWAAAFQILDKVAPQLSQLGERGRREKMQATLHVPLDLRLKLDSQWDALRPRLKLMQDALLAFCGRQRVYQDPETTVTRDLYCYLLAKEAGMNAREIAAEVFPNEEKRPAAAKVRKIISDFATKVAAAELSPREK
jgi:hypothetical protein